MLFCLTSYFLMPVVSFGVILLTMGFTQCGSENKRTRAAYLAVTIITIFFGMIMPLKKIAALMGL